MKTRSESRPVCGYCHQVAPSANHVHMGDFALCTDGGSSSCHSKFLRLQKAKNEMLRILFLGRGVCDDAICAERVANATRLSTLRRLAEVLLRRANEVAAKLYKKAAAIANEIFARLMKVAELVGIQTTPCVIHMI